MIYFNNAATGWPKFSSAVNAMNISLEKGMLSANRDSVVSREASAIVFAVRYELGQLIHAEKQHEIILTPSDTIALNTIMLGMGLKAGDCIIIDSMSHNALARPAKHLSISCGVHILYANTYAEIESSIRNNKDKVKGAFFSHASNVTGDVIDIYKIGNLLYKYKVPFILDAAQSLGIIDIDVEKAHLSALAFAGHKGLNGPQGTGGFYIRKGFEINPILFGGTGTESMSINPPIVVPDSYEVGTPAMHDIVGLYFSIIEIQKQIGLFTYRFKLRDLAGYAYKLLAEIPNVIMYGDPIKEIPVISFNIKGKKCKEVGDFLGKNDIICRTGIHCAALALRRMGCVDEFGGTVRVSFGYYNTRKEIEKLAVLVEEFATAGSEFEP